MRNQGARKRNAERERRKEKYKQIHKAQKSLDSVTSTDAFLIVCIELDDDGVRIHYDPWQLPLSKMAKAAELFATECRRREREIERLKAKTLMGGKNETPPLLINAAADGDLLDGRSE